MLDKLEWTKVRDSVAVHVPCSSKKMGLADAFTQVASLCAHEVTHTGIPCCGKPLYPYLFHIKLIRPLTYNDSKDTNAFDVHLDFGQC